MTFRANHLIAVLAVMLAVMVLFTAWFAWPDFVWAVKHRLGR